MEESPTNKLIGEIEQMLGGEQKDLFSQLSQKLMDQFNQEKFRVMEVIKVFEQSILGEEFLSKADKLLQSQRSTSIN